MSIQNLAVVEYSDERVLTTEQLAQVYECNTTHIKQNFNNNKENFVEGEHYFKLEGAALDKLRVENFDLQISPMTRSLYLWTRKGAVRHCKMLNTVKAWEMFNELEENYFGTNKKSVVTTDEMKSLIGNPQFVIELCQALIDERAEKQELRNIVDMQAVEIAELTPKASYYDLILQSKEALPVSVIAKDYGMSARKFNALLLEMRIQYKLKSGVWLVYQDYAKEGYTCTKTFPMDDGTTKTHTYWTQKGRLFLYEMLKRRGIIPLIEKVDEEEEIANLQERL